MRETDPRLTESRIKISEWHAAEEIRERRRLTTGALIWIGSGIGCFLAITLSGLYFWVWRGFADVPNDLLWLPAFWAASGVPGARVMWLPMQYYFTRPGRSR